ncbi:MAG: hypothetical protein ACJ8HJ_03405, partial [Massilia sp.]
MNNANITANSSLLDDPCHHTLQSTEFRHISSIWRHFITTCRQLIYLSIIEFLIHIHCIYQLLNDMGEKSPDNPTDQELPATGEKEGKKKAA